MQDMPTWLVTGSSGFLGYHMVNFLLKKGQKVVGLDTAPCFPEFRGKIRFVQGDVRDPATVRKAMQGVDVVMHGAAALPKESEQAIWDVNYQGTRNLLEAARDEGARRFIHISTTAVYGIPRTHPIPESFPLDGVGPYGESKVAAERLAGSYREDMVVSILRPKTFVGTVRLGIFSVLFDWVYRGKNLPVIGNGENRYQLLEVDDLVSAIWLMSRLPRRRASDTYNVGATEFGTINSHLQTLLDYRGKGKLVHFPAGPVKAALRVLDRLGLSPLYAWAYETLDRDHFVAVDRLLRVGWKPTKSSEQALLDSYKWYEKHRQEYLNKSGTTHTVQWKQGVLGIVRDLFF